MAPQILQQGMAYTAPLNWTLGGQPFTGALPGPVQPMSADPSITASVDSSGKWLTIVMGQDGVTANVGASYTRQADGVAVVLSTQVTDVQPTSPPPPPPVNEPDGGSIGTFVLGGPPDAAT